MGWRGNYMLEQPIKENNSFETDVSAEKCLVSVIVPVYNVEKYLNRCIESIVNQTYKNLEILLIDDGSPDNCPLICDEWAKKDKRIRVIHKENEGLGMARNTGIDNANGEYIFFFDSDDYVDLNTVEGCLKNAKQYNSSMVLFGFSEVYEDNRIVPIPIANPTLVYSGNEILNNLLPNLLMESFGIGISVWSKMFRLSVLKENCIKFKSEKEIISEDGYFTVELLGKIDVASIVSENYYYYYKNNNSLSRTYRKDRQIKNGIFLQKCLEHMQLKNYPEIAKKAVIVCYHGYTIGAIKQIFAADIDKKIKKQHLSAIYKNSLLRNTLKFGIISIEKNSLKLFWLAVKFKQYWLCRLLLLYRLKVKK